MCPAKAPVVGSREFVGDDTEDYGLLPLAKDSRGEKAEAIAGVHLYKTWRGGVCVGQELAIGIDIAGPVEGTYALRCAERGGSEEPASVGHLGDVGHFPECAVGRLVAACKELVAAVAPTLGCSVIAVEGSGAYSIL